MDILKNLNDRQREAVTAPPGPVLVLAGAGSGKTRVLTYRIAYLLSPSGGSPEGRQKPHFRPEEILALTFTNKAAGEMRGRIGGIRGIGDIGRLTAGTFHAVCARWLREFIEQLNRGYTRSFVIYDTDDQQRLLKQITLELGVSENFRPQIFGYYISAAKNKLLRTRDLALDNSYFQETLAQVEELYIERLRENNALDFDDLLKLTCELLQGHRKILEKLQKRFRYILVDEYQDTNHAQYVLLKLLTAAHRNLFVVGDDAQSIYGFRGANMQNILNFKKDYPRARVIMLEQNYRSTQAILDAAHKVIALNPRQYEKKLWTDSKGGEKVSLYEAADEYDEAEFVLERIMNAAPSPLSPSTGGEGKGGGKEEKEIVYEPEETPILNKFMNAKWTRPSRFHIPYSSFSIPDNLSEIVILYRTHAQSRPFEEALLSASVPYQIVGGIKFYERREVKDVLAYLRLVANPRDLVSLARVINVPARGIGNANLKLINQGLAKFDFNHERLLNNIDKLELSPRAVAGAREFFELLSLPVSPSPNPSHQGRGSKRENSSPFDGGGREGVNLLDIIDFMLSRSGYRQELLKEGEEGLARLENIEQLVDVAAKYKHLPWRGGLPQFLEEVALMTDLDTAEEGGNKLTLMTLHSAKGLEFEKVFFVGLEEGLLPHSRSLNSPEEVAEEIRLAYVGITRAKQNLYLSYARQRQVYGEYKRAIPSRILKAIPKRLLRKLN